MTVYLYWPLLITAVIHNTYYTRQWRVNYCKQVPYPNDVVKDRQVHFRHLVISVVILTLYLEHMNMPNLSWWTIPQVVLVYYMTLLWFYATHRMMHHPRLYRFHKQHHKYTEPPPYTTFYCSLTEHLLVNTGSLMVPLWLCPLPYWITLVYSYLVFNNAVQAHMGTKFQNSAHLIHHQRSNVNFGAGAGSQLDLLFGTHHTQQ